jgi:rhodanese-related sulfurtransferase
MRHWSRDAAIADVRSSEEYETAHILKSRSLPLERLRPGAVADAFDSDCVGQSRPLYLLSQTGYRATLAAEQLGAAGLHNLAVVDGGVNAWRAAGLPLVQPRRRIVPPVPNQMQALIGIILLAISLLALEVHAFWFLLTPVIGATLIYAGMRHSSFLTRWLGRLPWNRSADTSQTA